MGSLTKLPAILAMVTALLVSSCMDRADDAYSTQQAAGERVSGSTVTDVAAIRPEALDALPSAALDKVALRVNEWKTVDTGRKASGGYQVGAASISDNGRWIVFDSAADNLVREDSNRLNDIFVLDTENGGIRRVSVDSVGQQGNGSSSQPSISPNGSHVVFRSVASNLVDNDTNDTADIFLHELETGKTLLASLTNSSMQIDVDSRNPSVSWGGRHVAFETRSSNVVKNDTNAAFDVFVRDIDNGSTSGVTVVKSRESNSANYVNADSSIASLSANGVWLAFQSVSPNLIEQDGNGTADIFLANILTGKIKRLTERSGLGGNAESLLPSISSNARYVAFQSMATNLLPLETNGEIQVYRYDALTDEIRLISANDDGYGANGPSFDATVSDQGTVAFTSLATNLSNSQASNGAAIYVSSAQNQNNQELKVFPIGLDADLLDKEQSSANAAISADGSNVVFLGASTLRVGTKVQRRPAMFLSVASNLITENLK